MVRVSLPVLAMVLAVACWASIAPAAAAVLPGVNVSGVNCSVNALNDIKLLNFALTLEHLDTTFFRTYNARFNVSDFVAAGYPASVRDRLVLLEQHEAAHGATIAAAISARGGQPVPFCNYSFPVETVQDYILIGRLLENVGTSAYDGGFNALSDPDLAAVVSTIATVEARHAAFLNELLGQSPFPNATDEPKTASQVVLLARPFIVSCPYAWNDTEQLPSIRPSGSAYTTLQQPPPPSNSSEALVPGTYTLEQAENDVRVLQYALTLENLESAFYTQGLASGALSRQAFADAQFNDAVYDELTLIREHEASHVAALTAILTARGATAPGPCSAYNFSGAFESPAAFIATAALLESTGVSAYDGAGGGISDTFLQEAAATIATVEARHSAFLNRLNGQLPFNSSQDVGLPPAAVLAAAAQFISECAGNLPTELPSVVPPNSPAPCPPERVADNDSCGAALSALQTSGFQLQPAFDADTTSYSCSSDASASTGGVSLTVDSDNAFAKYTLFVDGVEGSQQLQAGQSVSLPSIGNISSAVVRVRVSVPGVLLALGDSISFGETNLTYGVFDGTERGYPMLVAQFLAQQQGDEQAMPLVENLAIDGETAASFATAAGRLPPTSARGDTELARQNAHYAQEPNTPQAAMLNRTVANLTDAGLAVQAVFITLGFNDLAALAVNGGGGVAAIPQTLADYRVQYRVVLSQVRALLPSADLYLLGYYNPFPADPANPAAPIFNLGGPMLNAVIAQLAREFAGFFVDPTPLFVGQEGSLTYLAEQPASSSLAQGQGINGQQETLPLGNIHPRPAGYQLIADQLIARIQANGTQTSAGCVRQYVIACDGSGGGQSSSSGGAPGASGGDGSSSSSGADEGAEGSGGDLDGAAASVHHLPPLHVALLALAGAMLLRAA